MRATKLLQRSINSCFIHQSTGSLVVTGEASLLLRDIKGLIPGCSVEGEEFG